MLKINCLKYSLKFKRPAGTSRGVLIDKDTYILKLTDTEQPNSYGLGECNLFRGLSYDDRDGYENKLDEIQAKGEFYVKNWKAELLEWPSLSFGIEMAIRDLEQGGKRILFDSPFSRGNELIPINGLIWMGEKAFMKEQIRNKLDQHYNCLKLKIGAIDFEQEVDLLKSIRDEFPAHLLEIRVDANGAFKADEAIQKLNVLSKFEIHSIEQPIRQGQWKQMAELCAKTPVPIALDEELIGINHLDKKQALLDEVKPQYIILKPALLGGFSASEEWIDLAEKRQIPWWITSALESNVGLNAIAQWTYNLNVNRVQGLGTGQIYTNNIPCPLYLKGAKLGYDINQQWDLKALKF
jgi:o-succinylbenzoate synthase